MGSQKVRTAKAETGRVAHELGALDSLYDSVLSYAAWLDLQGYISVPRIEYERTPDGHKLTVYVLGERAVFETDPQLEQSARKCRAAFQSWIDTRAAKEWRAGS